MEIFIDRLFNGTNSTLGLLSVNGKPNCFSCEDEYRIEKRMNETRIPAGRYRIKYRDEGGMVKRYKAKYAWHKGMVHLQDVPGFTYIYIHPGNTEADTSGCILVGKACLVGDDGGGSVQYSNAAYKMLYSAIGAELDANDPVFISLN